MNRHSFSVRYYLQSRCLPTIHEKLSRNQFRDYNECMHDIQSMFRNFKKDSIGRAKHVESMCMKHIKEDMPPIEVELTIKNNHKKPKKGNLTQ